MRYGKRMKPAADIISKLGGVAEIAAVVGVHRTRVYGWMRNRDAGGTGGLIPQKHHLALLRMAREKGVELKPEEFLPCDEAAA